MISNETEMDYDKLDIVTVLSKGYAYKEAAKILDISVSSIEKKIGQMRKEYHCKNNVHLFVKLTKVGII